MQQEIEQKKKMESQSKEDNQPALSPNKPGGHKVFLLVHYMTDFSHVKNLVFCKYTFINLLMAASTRDLRCRRCPRWI